MVDPESLVSGYAPIAVAFVAPILLMSLAVLLWLAWGILKKPDTPARAARALVVVIGLAVAITLY